MKHGQDEMLDGDVIVLEFFGFVLGADQKLVEPLRDADLPAGPGTGDLGDVIKGGLRFGKEKIERNFKPLEEAGDKSAFLCEQCVEEVLDVDSLIAEACGFVLGGAKGRGRPFGKLVQIHKTILEATRMDANVRITLSINERLNILAKITYIAMHGTTT